MRMLVSIAVLAALVGADDAVGVCAPSCLLGGSASTYEAGMQYQYQYQGEATTSATAGQKESRLALTAEVVIAANTPCDLKLQVMNLVVEDASKDDAKWFSEAVQEHDLHFSYQHGTITHLCPHDEEEAVATNFKRGILSALQMTVSPRGNQSDVVVSEVDVTGQCDTKYSLVLEPTLEVTKTKTGCHSSSYIPHLPHSHYTSTKANTQLPFTKSNQTCHMEGGGGGAWQKVECTEVVEVQRPLTPGTDTLASVKLSSTLSLVEGPTPTNGNFSKGDEMKRKVSLIADLKAAVEFAEMKKLQASGMKEQVESVLESLSASESPDGDELKPRLFSNFIYLLGHLEEEELEAVWDDTNSEKDKRKVLLDGLLVCDATPCHGLVARLAAEQGQLTAGQVNMWLAGLHLHTAAHSSLVTQLLDLAKSKKAASSALMAASSVVHRLCQQPEEECAAVAQPFLEFVDEEVGESCGLGKTKQQQEHIKLILRALGNAGVMPSTDFPEKCYMNRALPPELRITALQTYRRTGCGTGTTETPWKLLKDSGERSEVRIAAYLALVPCAAHYPGFFTRVHKLLEQEEVQQVYSFIWTHMKNLAEQPGPGQHDQTLSKLARQHSLPHKFNNDAFRASGHHRYTAFSELLNLGSSLDASVVYSQDSYLPQQVSANLTLDLLENSFNFLDFGGEFSGLENIIEGYFGKEGYFSNEDILKVLQSLRPKRNIIHDDKIQEFQKMYDKEKGRRKLGAEEDEMEEEEPKMSFYVRMFGNEVFYVENVLQYSPAQLLYHLIQEISTPKIFKIVDQEYMAPTFLGFPLRLKLNATASVSIQHEHTFGNGRQSGLHLKGSLTPTVVAAMDETLLLDAFVSSSGLRRSSTQLAKVNFGGELSFDEGEVAELQVSVPEEEVVKVSSSVTLALLQGDGGWEELEGASPMKEDHCTGTLEDVVGLKTCASLSRNTHEVDGQQVTLEPYKSEFKMIRTDTFKYYKLYIKRQDSIVEALFDTPGSSIDRKLHFLFNINPNREGGDIIVRGVGYVMTGKYRNTQTEKMLQLQTRKDSEVLGGLEVSLKKQQEGSTVKHMPTLELVVGPDKYTLGGNLTHGTDKETKETKAFWEVEGAWRKRESAEVTQAFASASGNFSIGPEETSFILDTQYGSDPAQPHNVTITLGSAHTLQRNMKTSSGHAGIQISQLSSGLMLQYEVRPNLLDLSVNASIHGTEVMSEVVLKDVTEGGGQDSQLTFSLASPQLSLDYKASGIYKVSESGLHAEAELNLGSSLKSKILLTYLFEDDPLHILTGLHLSLDDFVFQVGYSIDMSQPDHFLISASGTVGEGTAGVSLQADYGRDRPFNASLEVSAGLGTESIGLASHTASDAHWHNFTGRSTVKWLEWSGSLGHEVVFNETTKAIKLSLEEAGSVELFSKTWPDQAVKVVVRDAPGDSNPIFMLGAERRASSEECVVLVNLTSSDSQLMHLAWKMDSKNEFTFGLQLLESQLDVEGQYSVMENGTISGASQAKVMLPSGDSVSANLSLSYVTTENERLLMVSGSHEGSVVESQLVVSLGGSRNMEPSGVNFTLTTPLTHFQKFGFGFHKSGGADSLYSAGIELDEFEILGEARLSDPSNLLLKMEYEGGEECSSRLHLQHSQREKEYFSLASLALTQASKPWELVLNTSLDHSSHRQFLDTEFGLQAPVMPNPFHFHGLYNVTEDEVNLEMQTEFGESMSVIYQGKKEFSWKRHLLHGLGKVEASWIEPLAVNMTYDHTLGGINVNVDFQNEGDYISSWSTEFSSEYSSPEDIKASFYLTHPELQITMQMVHNQSQNSWRQQLDGSINTFTVTYSANTRWNQYLVPTKAEGSLSLFNFFDHSLDLSLSHLEESSTHKTQITGTFDDYNIGLDHQLSLQLADGGWQDSLQVSLRDIGATTGGVSLTTNTFVAWPAINSSLELESPWTDSVSATFVVQEVNMTTSFKLDALHKDQSLLSGQVVFDGWPSPTRSNIELEVTAVFMDELNLKLQHDFNPGNLIFGDVVYGSDVHMQLGSHLQMEESWYGQEFVAYSFNATSTLKQLDVDFKSVAALDRHLNATLEGHWNENSLSVNSSVKSGKILEVKFKNPDVNYLSELTYERGDDVLFTLNFTLLRDGENLVLFNTVVESINPKLDATLTLKLFADTDRESHGTIVVTADLSKLKKYALQGRLELESNLLTSKEYGGKLDLDLSFLSDLNWKAVAGTSVYGGEWDIRSDFNSSLEVSQGLSFEFGAGYHLLHGNQTFDLKDMNVVVSAKSGSYEMRVILHPDHTGPPWSLAVIYNPRFRTLKGFLSLAAYGKYELSLRLSTKTLTIDAHKVNDDDSKWQIVEGNINWIIKKTKQLVTLNMKSDIPAISKITGKVIVQEKRDLAVIATLKVNDDQFLGNFRLSTPEPGKSFRLDVKVDNSIVQAFESEVTVECSFDQSGFSFSMKIDLNQVSDWIQGSVKFSVPESYLKLKTPFSLLESFNVTVRTKGGEEYAVETVIEAPQFCWNLTTNLGRVFLHGSLNINLDIPCGGDSLFDFHVQYNITKNPIGISCELSTVEYGSLFKFNTTGHLSNKRGELKIETEAYPQHSFGLEVAYQVQEQYNLKLRAYSPPSNETYFTFETLLSPSKAELTFKLSEDQSLLLKANYDYQDQPLKLNVTLASSLFGQELAANMAGQSTLGNEEGKVEMSFSSNTIFSYLNVSTTYNFIEELKDITFKILTPKGDADGEIRVLKDKGFYKIEADMTSGLHSFDKYSLRVSQTTEDNVEKLEAMLAQGEREYRLTGLRNTTEKGTEANLNVSLPFEGYEHINLYSVQPKQYSSGKYLIGISLESQGEVSTVEAKHDPDSSLYQLVFNETDSGGEYVYTLRFNDYPSFKYQIEVVLDGPELEGSPLTLLLKYHHDSLVSAMFYSPNGQLGAELSWTNTADKIAAAGTADLTLCDLGEFHLDTTIPLVLSEKLETRLVCVFPEVEAEVRLHSGDYLRTGGVGLTLKDSEQRKDYSLVYDFTDSLVLQGQFDQWSLNTTLALEGTQHAASAGTLEVRSNLPGYETIDGTWDMGQRNWEYFCRVSLEVKHQEALSVSATLNTLSEGAYRPWQNVRLTMLLESPFTLPHHLHAEYQTSTPKLLLYYQHGLDIFKMQLDTFFGRNSASLSLTGNIPVRGVSTFDVSLAYNFENAFSMSVVMKVEDSTLEHKFDFSRDWRVGSMQMSLTSPFLQPGKLQFSWSLVQNAVNLKGFFNLGEHSGKIEIKLKNSRSSAEFECHVTSSLEELSQFIVNLSYKASGSNNFDASIAAKLNDNGVLMKSSLDTKGGKLLLKFQGTFEILGNRGSLDLDVGPSGDGYSGSALGQLPGYKKFSAVLYFDSYKLSLKSMYDSQELFVVSITYSKTRVHFFWTDHYSFTLTTEHVSKGIKQLLTMTFTGFGIEPITLEASYTKKRNHQVDLSLTSSLLPPSTLKIAYSGNKITVQATMGEKTYLMTGRATFRSLQSSFSVRFESSDRPDDPVILQAEYDLTDFFRGRMKAATELAQITLDWGEKVQVMVSGQRNGEMAKIDLKVETPLESLPRLHTGFHGEFFHKGLIGFNCTAFVEWSERIEVTTIAKLTLADVDVECTLTTSFPSLEKLSTSFRFEPGQVQLTAQHNADTWKAVWEYQFTPFSITCLLETPIENLEKISLSLAVDAGDEEVRAQFALSWAKDQRLSVDLEAKRWQLEVNFQTPWEPLTSGTFTASLRTESEELTLSSTLRLDDHEVEVTFVLLSTNFKFSATYSKNLLTVGLAKLEYSQGDENMKILLQVQTPYEGFKFLESSLEYGGNKVSFIFTINEIVNSVEGVFSGDGGEFTANLPLLNDFRLSMKSERAWLKAEASLTFSIAGTPEPLTASLSYNAEPQTSPLSFTLKVVLDEELMSVDVQFDEGLSLIARFMKYSLDLRVGASRTGAEAALKLEAPDLGLESVEIESALGLDTDPFEVDFTLSVLVKHFGKESLLYKIRGTGAVEEDQVLLTSKIEGSGTPTYRVVIRSPLDALGLQIVVKGDDTEWFTLLYSSGAQTDLFLPQKFVFQARPWEVEGQLLVTYTSLTASLTLPKPSGEHTLTVLWPDRFSLQELEISAELRSSYIPQDVLQLAITYKLSEASKGKMELGVVFGDKELRAHGDYQYDDRLQTFTVKFQLTSDWVGDYSLQTSAQWRRNIVASASLQAPGEEHSLSLYIDTTNSAIELKLTSPQLPAREITFTGELSSPLNWSAMALTSRLQADDEEVQFEVRFESEEEHTNSNVLLRRNSQDIFSLSLEMYEDVDRTDFELSIDLFLEGLENSIHVRYYNADWGRYFSGTLDSHVLTETVKLTIINSHSLGELQSIELNGPDFEFLIDSNASIKVYRIVTRLGYDRLNFTVSSDLFEEKYLGIKLSSTFTSFESLVFYAGWKELDKTVMKAEYSGNGQTIKFRGDGMLDDVFGYSINAVLVTSIEGYERFALFTPRHKSGEYSKALLEYPGTKVGAEMNLNYQHITESDFAISLYLPYENFEIVSVKYIMDMPNRFEIEARTGKIGLTLASFIEPLDSGMFFKSIVGVNEYRIKTAIYCSWALPKRARARYTSVFEPRELAERHSFHAEVLGDLSDRVFFTARDNIEELVTVHAAWGADKILTLVTPKTLPGYVHLNLECSATRDDYRFEFGLPTADWGAWTVYGAQLHQEVLPGGRHLALLGHAGEYSASVEGTLSVNSCHFNNSLVLSVNQDRLGYRALLLSRPALFSRTFTSDFQLLLRNRTLLYHTDATASPISLDLISNFTWNKMDMDMPPITFKLNYDDDTFFFVSGTKYFSAVLSHPDIKDLRLQANLTRSLNSSLHGAAELVDDNSPEMKVVATLQAQPARQDGGQTVSLSLSQPASNLSLLVGAQLRQSAPLSEAQCHLQYYSLASEDWQRLNLSANLEAEGSRRVLTVAAAAPEGGWGRTWRWALDGRPEEASVLVEGSSDGPGATWRLGATIRRRLPELHVYLSLGSQQEVQQEARLRLGLHSPVEAGAALDHFSFGQWHRDSAALGLRLTSPHVLQAFMEFDPSLDYEDPQDWAYLFSPAAEVADIWGRDVLAATQGLQQWAAAEVPAALGVLFSNETVDTVWQREASNWDYFVKDVEDSYQGIIQSVTFLWESVLLPVLEAVKDFALRVYSETLTQLASLKDRVQHAQKVVGLWLWDTWQSLKTQSVLQEAVVRDWVSHSSASLGQSASTFWSDLLQQATWLGEQVSTSVTTFLEESKSYITTLGQTVEAALSSAFQTIQPHFEGLAQAFQSYGSEVLAEFTGPCWMALTDKGNSLAALAQGVDGGTRVLTEFLQTEKFSAFFVEAGTWLQEKASAVWSSLEASMAKASQSLPQALSSWNPPLSESFSQAWDTLSRLADRVSVEGLYPLVESLSVDLRESVSQLPGLVSDSLEPVHNYLNQFSAFKSLGGALRGIYQQGEAAWEDWSSGKRTGLSLPEQLVFLLADAAHGYVTSTNYLLNHLYVAEPSRGHVHYNQYLPPHWDSFLELPQWSFPSHLFQKESAAREAERLMATACPDPSLVDALLPFHTATAVIAGQHVTSFDLRHYQFLGSCSYLLAKDFEGGDFEVFGEYESEDGATRLKSVVVHGPNLDVTLSVDGSVTSRRLSGAEIHNSTEHSALKMPDLFLSCHRALRGCSLTISSKYFGRVGGLLGNYNGEASDDLRGPGLQVVQDAAQLATHWAISPTPCYQANQAYLVKDYSDVEEAGVRECSQLFLYSNSPFSECFQAVDPHPYFTHCIEGRTHPAFTKQELNAPCTAVAAYRNQCWARERHLPNLEKCQNVSTTGCTMEGKEVPYGWSQVYEETSHGSADVAIIVELAECNAGKEMTALLDHLERQLGRKNINDVRYAVVAAGKNKTVTKASLSKRDAETFLNSLTFNEATSMEDTEAVVAAAASEIEWRPGVSRSIVHVGCQACVRSDRASRALHQNDVTYHLVSSLEVEMSGTRDTAQARMRKLFGFDENLVYVPGDFKAFRGSEKLRLALRAPKGGCVTTALSTGGSVFDREKWTPRKAIQSRKFLKVLGERVAVSSSPPKCQECQCLKGDMRMAPTCIKCFGNSVFFVTHTDTVAEDPVKDTGSITQDIKRSFQEVFLERNNSTVPRIL